MAQQRLTQHVRDAILRAVISRAFDDREKALKERDRLLGVEVYHDVYSDTLIRKMADMPAGFLPEKDHFQVQFQGRHDYVNWGEKRRIADTHDNNRVVRQYDAAHRLAKMSADLEHDQETFRNEKSATEAQTRATLKSIRSYEKLIEVWPEIEPLARPFRQNEAKATTYALALPITQLNKALGLPPQ